MRGKSFSSLLLPLIADHARSPFTADIYKRAAEEGTMETKKAM